MWLESRYRRCLAAGPVVFLAGGERYGAPFLVDRLRRDRAVAWLAVDGPGDADPVSLGNLLAQAVNGTVGGTLLQSALPYQVHLRTLAMRRDRLTPFTFALSGAEFVPEFAASIAELAGGHYGLWLLAEDESALDDLPVTVGAVLDRDALRLTLPEARELAPKGLGDLDVAALHESSDGAYTEFLVQLHRRAGLPEIVIPAGDGWVYPRSEARFEDPADVLEAMTRLERWIDALEVAAEHLPERVEDLLREAGPAYQQKGLLRRLDLLLSILPPELAERERTLEWGLVAAHQSGEASRRIPAVRRFLETHEAPELRSRFATFLPYEDGLKEAERAVQARETPLTLWQLGRMHPDAHRGIGYLIRSVDEAELNGDAYGCVRAAGTLAERFTHLGDFVAAHSWSDWALKLYAEHALEDGLRRLRLVKQFAFARILLGDTAGLREQLRDEHANVENILPELAASFRGTLADIERLEGDPVLAARYTEANLEAAPRGLKPSRAIQHVRSLLELGLPAKAMEVARSALVLSTGMSTVLVEQARVALGMAQSFCEPDAAVESLGPLLASETLVFEHRAMAALHFLLARPDGTRELPSDLRERLGDLSETALNVLSGPQESFHRVWSSLSDGGRPALELRVLGRTSARLEGSEVALTRRQWEILVALALHPGGLDYGSLHAFLLQDDDRLSAGTLRSHVSHLRSRIPVSDTPYRITVPYTIDIIELQEHLRQGRVREAVALATGPLLPRSSLPGIRQLAEQIENELRESLLMSGDGEALYSATSLWDDDLEVWEAGLHAMHPRDPRVPLLKARVSMLRSEYGPS